VQKAANDCIVVGGGAAGLATAIFAARRNPSWKITIVDGAKRLGAKILISGGGRCNVTNDVVTPDDFWGGSRHIIRRILQAFPAQRAIAFFQEIGVPLHVEAGGKMFPNSNRAVTVLNALTTEVNRLGVRVMPGQRVTDVHRQDMHFELITNTETHLARHLVLATGGMSVAKTGSDGSGYRLAKSLGHSTVTPTPALVGLVLNGEFHKNLSGISHDVELTVHSQNSKSLCLAGSLLWTHFGLSGPVVLNASRHWHNAHIQNKTVTIHLNLLPGTNFETADCMLLNLTRDQTRAALHNRLSTLIPARVAETLLQSLGIRGQQPIGQLSREDRRKLVQTLIAMPVPVRTSRGFPYAEVTAGGIPLDEIYPNTMESRVCPRLFIVGEMLDVDGRIGGFNFQWAWSSAWVAASGLNSQQQTNAKPQI
jgi:predicted Rossmann fold flavoprotein